MPRGAQDVMADPVLRAAHAEEGNRTVDRVCHHGEFANSEAKLAPRAEG